MLFRGAASASTSGAASSHHVAAFGPHGAASASAATAVATSSYHVAASGPHGAAFATTSGATSGCREALDEELRRLLLQIFPHLLKGDKLQLILPSVSNDQLTVGKLFSGLTILENWRNYRASMKRRVTKTTTTTTATTTTTTTTTTGSLGSMCGSRDPAS